MVPDFFSSPFQVADMSECVGSALIQKGFKTSPDQYIGIFSQNRPEVLTVRRQLCAVLRVLTCKSQLEFIQTFAWDPILCSDLY